MDGCEDCAMAYAELLDALIGLEEAIGQEPLSQPPALPARLTMAMRLRGWVLKLSQEMAAALKLADPANFEAAAQALMGAFAGPAQPLTPPARSAVGLGLGEAKPTPPGCCWRAGIPRSRSYLATQRASWTIW